MINTTKELKQLRADLDLLIVLGGQVKDSRETATAFTKLQEGKMHVGNTLFEFEQAHLYKESFNASSNVIEKYHVDEDIIPMQTPNDWWISTIIQKIKIMRRELDLIQARLKNLTTSADFINDLGMSQFAWPFITEVLIKLRETQNWYGMELGRLREVSNDH